LESFEQADIVITTYGTLSAEAGRPLREGDLMHREIWPFVQDAMAEMNEEGFEGRAIKDRLKVTEWKLRGSDPRDEPDHRHTMRQAGADLRTISRDETIHAAARARETLDDETYSFSSPSGRLVSGRLYREAHGYKSDGGIGFDRDEGDDANPSDLKLSKLLGPSILEDAIRCVKHTQNGISIKNKGIQTHAIVRAQAMYAAYLRRAIGRTQSAILKEWKQAQQRQVSDAVPAIDNSAADKASSDSTWKRTASHIRHIQRRDTITSDDIPPTTLFQGHGTKVGIPQALLEPDHDEFVRLHALDQAEQSLFSTIIGMDAETGLPSKALCKRSGVHQKDAEMAFDSAHSGLLGLSETLCSISANHANDFKRNFMNGAASLALPSC